MRLSLEYRCIIVLWKRGTAPCRFLTKLSAFAGRWSLPPPPASCGHYTDPSVGKEGGPFLIAFFVEGGSWLGCHIIKEEGEVYACAHLHAAAALHQ